MMVYRGRNITAEMTISQGVRQPLWLALIEPQMTRKKTS